MQRHVAVARALREWLRGHYSVISTYEAVRLGASRKLIRNREHSGAWIKMCTGVYRDAAVEPHPFQALRAAYLITHGEGVISHAAAAWMWGLLRDPPVAVDISIVASSNRGRSKPNVRIHRSLDLNPGRACLRAGLPLTNPLRTLVDLAAIATPEQLTDAVDAALTKRLVTVAALLAEIDRLSGRGRPGVGILRDHLLDRGFLGVPPASVLEAKLRRIVVALPVELPTFECVAGPDGEFRIDIGWGRMRFAVETDGYAWHCTPEQSERDNRRRNRLQDQGWVVKVYTWRDICQSPARVGAEILATYRDLMARNDRTQ